MGFSLDKVLNTAAKVVSVANKVADGVHKYGSMGIDYAKMAPEDWKLPVKSPFLQNITGTISKVLGTAEKIVDPFRANIQDIPVIGKALSKGVDFALDTALPFLQKPVTQSISLLGKFMPTIETIVDWAGKIGKALDTVENALPVQQNNARNIVAERHARFLESAN